MKVTFKTSKMVKNSPLRVALNHVNVHHHFCHQLRSNLVRFRLSRGLKGKEIGFMGYVLLNIELEVYFFSAMESMIDVKRILKC